MLLYIVFEEQYQAKDIRREYGMTRRVRYISDSKKDALCWIYYHKDEEDITPLDVADYDDINTVFVMSEWHLKSDTCDRTYTSCEIDRMLLNGEAAD